MSWEKKTVKYGAALLTGGLPKVATKVAKELNKDKNKNDKK